jgi:hypothetical protein
MDADSSVGADDDGLHHLASARQPATDLLDATPHGEHPPATSGLTMLHAKTKDDRRLRNLIWRTLQSTVEL